MYIGLCMTLVYLYSKNIKILKIIEAFTYLILYLIVIMSK